MPNQKPCPECGNFMITLRRKIKVKPGTEVRAYECHVCKKLWKVAEINTKKEETKKC